MTSIERENNELTESRNAKLQNTPCENIINRDAILLIKAYRLCRQLRLTNAQIPRKENSARGGCHSLQCLGKKQQCGESLECSFLCTRSASCEMLSICAGDKNARITWMRCPQGCFHRFSWTSWRPVGPTLLFSCGLRVKPQTIFLYTT